MWKHQRKRGGEDQIEQCGAVSLLQIYRKGRDVLEERLVWNSDLLIIKVKESYIDSKPQLHTVLRVKRKYLVIGEKP